MKLKTFSCTILIIGLLSLIVSIAVPVIIFCTADRGANGIIGGASGPTYQLIVLRRLNGWPVCLMAAGVALTVTALFCFLFPKTVKKNCSVKTSVIAAAISAVGAGGISCFLEWFGIVAFHAAAQYPVAYPASVAGGVACFGIMILLLVGYCSAREGRWSLKGLAIDVFTSILYLPVFLFGFSFLYNVIS